jgi:hypothetical protein
LLLESELFLYLLFFSNKFFFEEFFINSIHFNFEIFKKF